MSYNIFNFFVVNATSLVIGILSATLAGSIGYLTWLFFQKRTAKFFVAGNIWFLKLILLSFIAPLLTAIAFWAMFRTEAEEKFFYGVDMSLSIPMIRGLLLLVFVWFLAVMVVLIYRYASYWKVRYQYLMSVPVEDPDILMLMERWKKKLKIKKKVNVLYNETLSSPTIVHFNGYQILLPVYEMSTQELSIALLHELTHLKNKDIILKNIGFVVNIIHSFNPISYYIRIQIANWVEANCDLCCCETGKDEFEASDYFGCIMALKKRCQDQKQPDVISCLFESKELLEFRINAVKQTRQGRKRDCYRYMVMQTFFTVFVMLFSLFTVSQTLHFCYGKTLDYRQEVYIGNEDSEWNEGSKEDLFTSGKINYYDKEILNGLEGVEFSMDAGEIILLEVPERCGDKLSVALFCSGGSFWFGYGGAKDKIKYIEKIEDGTILIDKKDMGEDDFLFIKNMGQDVCQIEIFINEMPQ